jgi:hypothetical protein
MQTERIKSLLENSKEGIISLGIQNSWNSETLEDYRELMNISVPQSMKVMNLGRSYNKYEFQIQSEGKDYKVNYTVDSSD